MRARALAVLLVTSGVLVGCAGGPRRFPLKDPVWVDTDKQPVTVKCDKRPSKEDKNHVACAPDVYVSPLAWDAADNTLFRPI
jgi:hypothetical protein